MHKDNTIEALEEIGFGDNVIFMEATVYDIREITDEYSDNLATVTDEAQAKVFTGESGVAYVIIKVVASK